jgi:AAA domain/DnaB-like helicase N terminal domain
VNIFAGQDTSLDSEQSILGTLLLDCDDAWPVVSEVLGGDDFSRLRHRQIYSGVGRLRDQGTPVDLLTLSEHLKSLGLLEEVGGTAYLASLELAVVHPDNVAFHCHEVREKARSRRDLAHLGIAQSRLLNCHNREAVISDLLRKLSDTEDSGPKRFLALTIDEYYAKQVPGWLALGRIPENSLGMLSGQWSTFKSFLALDLALSVATGKEWLGAPVKQGPVVYVCAEGNIKKRCKAWAQDRGMDIPASFRIVDEPVYFPHSADWEAFRRMLQALPEQPKLIVIDTLSACDPESDEGSESMGRFIDSVNRIRREIGAAALIVHHDTKDGKYGRGSGKLNASLDFGIQTKRKANKDGIAHGPATVICQKLKDADLFLPFNVEGRKIGLEPEGPGEWDSLVLEHVGSPSDDPGDGAETLAEEMTILQDQLQGTDGLINARWLEQSHAAGVSKNKFYKAKDILLSLGYVVKHGVGPGALFCTQSHSPGQSQSGPED